MADTDLNAECRCCGHIWTVAKLPMPINKVAKLAKKAACPQCAADKPKVKL